MALKRLIACTAAAITSTGILVATPTPANAASYASTITMSVNTTTPSPGQGIWLQGNVSVSGASANGIGGRTVVLKRQDSPGVWSDIATTSTNSAGNYSFPYEYVRSGRGDECYHAYVKQKVGTNNTWGYDATDTPICVNQIPWNSTITMSVNTTTPAPEQGIWFQGDVTVSGGAGVGGRTVVLKRQDSPGSWSDILTVTTNSAGHYSFPYDYIREGRTEECYHAYVTSVAYTWTYDATDSPICVAQRDVDWASITQNTPTISQSTTDGVSPLSPTAAGSNARIDYAVASGPRTLQLDAWNPNTGQWSPAVQTFPGISGSGSVYTDPRQVMIYPNWKYRVRIHYSTGLDYFSPHLVNSSWPAAPVYEEEFSGIELDRTRWQMKCATGTAAVFPSGGNCKHQNKPGSDDFERLDYSTITLGDGTASFTATGDGAPCPNTSDRCAVKAGLIQAVSDADGDGVLEPYTIAPPEPGGAVWISARIKLHSGSGAHSSLWTPSGYSGGGDENDIVEYFGDNRQSGRVFHNVYWNSGTEAGCEGYLCIKRDEPASLVGAAYSQRYHIFTVRWMRSGYTYYIDGINVASIDRTTNPFAGANETPTSTLPAKLHLSMLAKDYENVSSHYYAGVGQFKVDWVRVWR